MLSVITAKSTTSPYLNSQGWCLPPGYLLGRCKRAGISEHSQMLIATCLAHPELCRIHTAP